MRRRLLGRVDLRLKHSGPRKPGISGPLRYRRLMPRTLHRVRHQRGHPREDRGLDGRIYRRTCPTLSLRLIRPFLGVGANSALCHRARTRLTSTLDLPRTANGPPSEVNGAVGQTFRLTWRRFWEGNIRDGGAVLGKRHGSVRVLPRFGHKALGRGFCWSTSHSHGSSAGPYRERVG